MTSYTPRELQQHRSKNLAIVKISRPSANVLLPRQRLFDLIDDYQKLPVTWISASAGSGKTALVTSYLDFRPVGNIWYQCDSGDKDIASFFYYLGLAAQKVQPTGIPPLPLLTSEYQHDITPFARTYFEELFLSLTPGSIIVFDNCQEIEDNSQLFEILAKVCNAVPVSIRCIFISRNTPPPAMARLQLHKQLGHIDGNNLRLTREEALSITTFHVRKTPSPETINSLHERSQGWMAGLILIISQKRGERLQPKAALHDSNEIIFDYFAGEIFHGASAETRGLLLSTAFLPEFTEAMAQEISGNIQSGKILDSLLRKNFFITRHSDDTYQFHPLFRKFLVAQAENILSPVDRQATLRQSAELLRAAGYLEEAATLFKKSGTQQPLITLILQVAPTLIAEGRGQTLQSWIEGVSLDQREINPWLLYWSGIGCMPFNLSDAQSHFKKAFVCFREQHDVAGTFAAWSGAVEAIMHELSNLSCLDPWIKIFDQILTEHGGTPPPQQENQIASSIFLTLVMRHPDHPRFSFWKEKALAVLSQEKNPSLRMITGFYLLSYNYWMGEIGAAASIRMEIEAMAGSRHASPLARLTGCLAVAWHGWMEGNHKTSLKAITDGLEISTQSGVVLWNYLLILQGAANTLSQGDADGADNWLKKLAGNLSKARGLDLFYYYHERGWQALLRERMQEALAYQQTALAHAEKVGCLPVLGQAHYGMSQICHENGLISERNHHLSECRRLGDLCQSRLLDFLFYLGEAHYALDDGDEESVRPHLEKAMNRGAAQFFCNVTFWRSSVMTRLCLRALQEGIEVEYVQQLIIKRTLQPLTPPLDLDTWPWRLRIYTFGTFSVVKDGQPLIFGKKAQAKILELLKALIAFGGKEVSEARLSEALWPDSDGDAAHQALATALFRLRKWLGVRDAIIRSAGKISLDPNLCWIDCWAFERLLEQSAQADDNFQYLTTKATKIYRGHFLSTDTDKPWTTLMRERLRGKMVRSIQTMADTLAAGDHYHYQEIISWYRHGIEIDPLAEEFYQGLMLCYYRAGEIGQAMRVYEDLKKVLVAAFAIEPSRKSQEIYRKLR